jgi:hypothetical protein
LPSYFNAGAKNMDDLKMAIVVARLEKIEKENRRMKRAALAAVLAAACVLVMGQARPAVRTVEAQSYILQDASGSKRAELVLEPGAPGSEPSPVLRFLDGKGNDTLSLSSTRLELAGKADLGPDILLDDAKGTARLDLGLQHNLPFVILNDEKGIVREHMGFSESGEPMLAINDEKAAPRVGLGFSNGRPSVSVMDSRGFSALLGNTTLLTTSTGAQRETSAASLVLFGPDGTLLWSAP